MKRNVLLARGAQLAGLIDALDFRLAQRAGEPSPNPATPPSFSTESSRSLSCAASAHDVPVN